MPRLLVLGDDKRRAAVCARLESSARFEVDDCDPALGDCVMYVRLEGSRYAAFVFLGYDHPVTRGALALVAERAVLVPLAETAPVPSLDGYLFRLPRGLGFSTEEERATVQCAIPKAASLPSELLGPGLADVESLLRLVAHAASEGWQRAEFTESIARDADAP